MRLLFKLRLFAKVLPKEKNHIQTTELHFQHFGGEIAQVFENHKSQMNPSSQWVKRLCAVIVIVCYQVPRWTKLAKQVTSNTQFDVYLFVTPCHRCWTTKGLMFYFFVGKKPEIVSWKSTALLYDERVNHGDDEDNDDDNTEDNNK